MSSESEKDAIKLQLLGLQDSDGSATKEQRAQVRQEILSRRERYLAAKRVEPSYAPRRPRWGAAAILVALAGSIFGAGVALKSATATQEKSNQLYAAQMLGTSERFDCQDLSVLSKTAAEAEDLLPDASALGLARNDWLYVYTASRAARCLFTARLGNAELAIAQVDSTRQLASLMPIQAASTDTRLIYNLCLGKAGQSVCELLVDRGERTRVLPYAESTLAALNDAYQGLGENVDLTPTKYALLAASVHLDIVRLRTRGINPASETLSQNYSAISRSRNLAQRHLENATDRGAFWWMQQLRLQAHDLLMQERSVGTNRIASDEINRLLSAAISVEQNVAAVSGGTLAISLDFQHAIYLSNLADLLASSLKDDQLQEFGPEVIRLRDKAIAILAMVPFADRTHLHHTNSMINYSRRMQANCEMAVFANQAQADYSSYLNAAMDDAQSLETMVGSLLGKKWPQLSVARQLLAAELLDYTDGQRSPVLVDENPPTDAEWTLIEQVTSLLEN